MTDYAKNMRISRIMNEISSTAPKADTTDSYGASCARLAQDIETQCFDKGDGSFDMKKCNIASIESSTCFQEINDSIQSSVVHGGSIVTHVGADFGESVASGYSMGQKAYKNKHDDKHTKLKKKKGDE